MILVRKKRFTGITLLIIFLSIKTLSILFGKDFIEKIIIYNETLNVTKELTPSPGYSKYQLLIKIK